MRLVKPVKVNYAATGTYVSGSTAPLFETGRPLWLIATAYTAGQLVSYLDSAYIALASTTGEAPNLFPLKWKRIAAVPRFKPFDGNLSDLASLPASAFVNWYLTCAETIDTICLLNLKADYVRIEVYDPSNATIYTLQLNIFSREVVDDWYEYFFTPFTYQTELLLDNIPAYSGCVIFITVSASSPAVGAVGEIVLGKTESIGDATVGGTIGIIDYSTKERDVYGNANIVLRAFARRITMPWVITGIETVRRVDNRLAELRSQATLFYTEPSDIDIGFVILGFYNDYEITVVDRNVATASIQIEGVI